MKFFSVIYLFLWVVLAVPLTAQAEDPSTCICWIAVGDSSSGDCQVAPNAKDETQCRAACTGSGFTPDFVQGDAATIDNANKACSDTAAYAKSQKEASASPTSSTTKKSNPNENPLCWSKEACEKDYTGDGAIDGKWDNTVANAREKCPGYGFCYAANQSFELNVALPNGNTIVKSVSDIGDYVNKMYLFMLGTAALFAVVRIMAAGVQYIAFPKGGEVSDAQKKISGALTGLALLACAALMLATVNPNMLSLQPPQMPKIRTFVYFGDDARCESYKDLGYGFEEDLSYSEEDTCGKEGKIITDTNGVPLGQVIKCTWTTCQGSDYNYTGSPAFRVEKTCYPSVKGEPACISCEDVTTGPPFVIGVNPSEGTCAQLQPTFHSAGDRLTAELGTYHAECVYSNDIGFEPREWLDAKTTGQCAVLAYNCESIKKCADYDAINVWNDDGAQRLDAFEAPGMFDYTVHGNICSSNPCEIAGGCKQDKSSTWNDLFLAGQAYFAPTTLGASIAVPVAIEALTGRSTNGLSCIPATAAAKVSSPSMYEVNL